MLYIKSVTIQRGRKAELYTDKWRTQYRVAFYQGEDHLDDENFTDEAKACEAINDWTIKGLKGPYREILRSWQAFGGEPVSR